MASQVHFTRMDPEVRKAHLIDATSFVSSNMASRECRCARSAPRLVYLPG